MWRKDEFNLQWLNMGLIAIIVSSLMLFVILPGNAQIQGLCHSASGMSRFGVNDVLGWPGLYPPERLERAFSLMEAAGISWVRVTWAWKDIQPQPGPFDFS